MTTPKYRRILLKLGGEALAGEGGVGINPQHAEEVAQKVKVVKELGVEIGIVIGGGNLWRGRTGIQAGMERVTADHIGMIGTVMNALALQDALERIGITTRSMTAFEMRAMAEPYIRRRAMRHLEKGRVVIFAGGTGNPYFSTDSAGALRGKEINADILVKATKVDGVYDDDPKLNPTAKKFERLTYLEAINLQVKVLDMTAVTMCRDDDLPILVLNLWNDDDLLKAMLGEKVGTVIGR